MKKLGKFEGPAKVRSGGCTGKQNTTQLNKLTAKEHMMTTCKYPKGAFSKAEGSPPGGLQDHSGTRSDENKRQVTPALMVGSSRLLGSLATLAPHGLSQ